VHPDVLRAQAQAMMGHRGPVIKEIMSDLQAGLKDVFCTTRPVLISTSSATGLMEAAVRNGARSRVLSLVNGAFSERFTKISRACGFEVETLEVEWGQAIKPDAVKKRLAKNDFDTVTVVHSETSTGALNPISDISKVVQEMEDVVLIVDSVTGVGGVEVQTDEWDLDFVLTGSQKALALPPGLAFGVSSPRLIERSKTALMKGVYFDLDLFTKHIENLQTPNTPALSLIYALAEQLRRIATEGMTGRWERHLAMARRCSEWVDSMRNEHGVNLSILAAKGERSPTVTCVVLPNEIDGPSIVSEMKNLGFVIGEGYGKLKNNTLRIGHMGDHRLSELDVVLEALQGILK
tara:strand:+ start:1096 stop:2142 length:1047 start_codon:yes stop_codon:yes gene_type:complete